MSCDLSEAVSNPSFDELRSHRVEFVDKVPFNNIGLISTRIQ